MKKLLLFVMILGLSSMLYAQTAIQPSGSGTEQDPYRIANLGNLVWIASSSLRWDKHYLQTANIDASESETWYGGTGWGPIGYSFGNPFTGTYDGDGYDITGLYIDNSTSTYPLGFFGLTYDATIKNVNLKGFTIIGNFNVGGLVGQAWTSEISGCFAHGSIVATGVNTGCMIGSSYGSYILHCHSISDTTGIQAVGGLVGYLAEGGVQFCSARGFVNGDEHSGGLVGYVHTGYIVFSNTDIAAWGWGWTGGLAGYVKEGLIAESYSKGAVVGWNQYAGGLIGGIEQSTISDCYSRSEVVSNTVKGGLVGSSLESYINHCFSTGLLHGSGYQGGLAGYLSFTEITNSYWDVQTTGTNASAGGEGRTTAQMTFPYSADTYVDWDFSVYFWAADTDYSINDGYPYLRSQTTPVYRFFNTNRGGHLYTISKHERDTVMALPQWSYEGPKFRVFIETPGFSDIRPVYRFWNTNTGIHLYTISDDERDTVMTLPQWNYEGIKFYVYEVSLLGTIPVYRFFNTHRGGHLYTISRHERDTVMELPQWSYEGIAFYVLPYHPEF